MSKFKLDKFIVKYSDMSAYGFNSIIKEYADFPAFLPLPAHMEHGWNISNDALKSDLATDKNLMLVFSARRERSWRKKSQIPVAVMGSPFILYRSSHKITKKTKARGTVAFPSHSTPALESKFDVEKYCRQLQKLPKKYHPLSICLIWSDYLSKDADIYRKAGFSVVTAGSKVSDGLDFVKNYYEILSGHKYATSNDAGSYIFYAVEMGIPFFLLGDPPLMSAKKGKRDYNVPKNYRKVDLGLGKYITNLFTGPVDKISAEQRLFVAEENGLGDCLSPKELNELLWKYFWKSSPYFRVPIYWFLNLARFVRDGLKPSKR